MAFSSRHKKVDHKPINWAELLPELISSIMLRFDAIEILENAQKVCKPWQRVAKDPSLWCKIDMQNAGNWGFNDQELENMCRHAFDRSKGDLVEINIRSFGSDQLLNYIADRSSNLRSFGLEIRSGMCEEGLVQAVAKLPLLEELKVSNLCLELDLKAIGDSCSRLNTFKLNWHSSIVNDDDDALAIAKSMPQLRHLQLLGNRLTDIGLNAILDNCSHLEHLDLRVCFNVRNLRNLEKRCSGKMKVLRRTSESTDDCLFLDTDSNFNDFLDYISFNEYNSLFQNSAE